MTRIVSEIEAAVMLDLSLTDFRHKVASGELPLPVAHDPSLYDWNEILRRLKIARASETACREASECAIKQPRTVAPARTRRQVGSH